MWIQVRTISGTKTVRIDNLSKLTKIQDLRKRLVEPFEAEECQQRLFFRGKQMEDDQTLYDYDVGLNDLIQILVRKNVITAPVIADTKEKEKQVSNGACNNNDEILSDKENKEPIADDFEEKKPSSSDQATKSSNSTYKVGDVVDARDVSMGAWFEAKIVKVEEGINKEVTDRLKDSSYNPIKSENKDGVKTEADESSLSQTEDVFPHIGKPDGFSYHIGFEKYLEDVLTVLSTEIRPRARTLLKFSEVQIGQHIMANYNYEDNDSRGFWYDCKVTDKKDSRTSKELISTVYIGADLTPLHDCKLLFTKELFGVESPGSQLTEEDVAADPKQSVEKRETQPECNSCQDNPRRKCKDCGCDKCGDKKDPEKTILCDECNQAWHLYCLNPPLETVPDDDEWYCPNCKHDETTIVRIGEKLKKSKKKSSMPSGQNKSTRDWGKGMACVGQSKKCTIVSSTYYGAIPGVEVGSLWKFRVQVSESGVHRPPVAGIHGREEDGAYSIVLSGGYEDDADDGDEFYYTGSGGRDLSGNKRTAEQSSDQLLTRMNKALAKNVNAKLNAKEGAEAEDWKGGKPVRVVRNCKGRKHSKYAPEEGNRYDGIYKIVKYWPEKGKSGFMVWRYFLRRDDPIPAPWTKAGKRKCEELGLEMQYPDGYLETQAAKEKEKEEKEAKEEEETPGKKKGRKRKADAVSEETTEKTPKKAKTTNYKLEENIKKLIKEDDVNRKLWDEAMTVVSQGSKVFHDKVEETFLCTCCQDIVCKPVTLPPCSHNICKTCLGRSFKAEVYSCPACRAELDKNMSMATNKALCGALNALFPGYEGGR